MSDILHTTSSHDVLGSITTVSFGTDRGRNWLDQNGGEDGVYIIEAEYAWMILEAAEDAGLTLSAGR